jgi:6-phosphofructokinase 1
MNASLRAVTRLCLRAGYQVFGVVRGFHGLVEGASAIRPLAWEDVGGILQAGGTKLSTARSQGFRTLEGRQRAVAELVSRGVDRLVVIGGDGSLTGAQLLFTEWSDHLSTLEKAGQVPPGTAERHPQLRVVGLPGSIDNDLPGSDVSIGADTALHRIVEAVDRIASTAASHHRIFVVEVMGRRCGYLALMGALATGADVALVPESPLGETWKDQICERVAASRQAGRSSTIVLVSEGARDHLGQPIRSAEVQQLLEDRLHQEVRVSILGHIQRGGAPSAFDRNLSTWLAWGAVQALASGGPPVLIGLIGNRPVASDLGDCLEKSREAVAAVDARDEERAMALRGPHFKEAVEARRVLVRLQPQQARATGFRIAVMHAGAPAAGMNTAVRAAVRFLADRGHTVLSIGRGMKGLVEGDIAELGWMDVSGWSPRGGAILGTSRKLLTGHELYQVAGHFQQHKIQALLLVGGMAAYETVELLQESARHYPGLAIPMMCVPATIDNNLPGTDFTVGADTALNGIVEVLDRIKQSAVATKRCFVVEVMGRESGYLALMSALASGAEKVYLPEVGITIDALLQDFRELELDFGRGRKVALVIRSEHANPVYTSEFLTSLFEQESHGQFDVRRAILGHLQQGGDPTPFDRTLAIRLTTQACARLEEMAKAGQSGGLGVGVIDGQVRFTELPARGGAVVPWWFALREVLNGVTRMTDPA